MWDDEDLFPERVEAWANGPVCRDLYDRHRGFFTVWKASSGNAERLSPSELATIDAVVAGYGKMPAQEADSAGHAAGSHSSGPTMNPRGGGE